MHGTSKRHSLKPLADAVATGSIKTGRRGQAPERHESRLSDSLERTALKTAKSSRLRSNRAHLRPLAGSDSLDLVIGAILDGTKRNDVIPNRKTTGADDAGRQAAVPTHRVVATGAKDLLHARAGMG